MASPRKFRRPTAAQAKRYAKRRAGRVARSGSDLSADQWATILSLWQACAYCQSPEGPFQKDCVQPIAHGGRYTATNVVPACRSCNASKSSREVTGWLRIKKFDEAAFLTRFAEINKSIAATSLPAGDTSVPTRHPASDASVSTRHHAGDSSVPPRHPAGDAVASQDPDKVSQ